jgi:basic amino acid/polyamine antiporter, APA family
VPPPTSSAPPAAAPPVPRAAPHPGLLRVLGFAFGLAVVVGGTIGVGILRTPGSVAALVPHPALFIAVWVAGALYALSGANYTAELATMLPTAGGPYVYAERAYGRFGGFVIGWSDWVINVAGLAFISIALAEYVGRLVPALAGAVKPVAAGALLGVAALNAAGVRAGSGTQQVTSALKALALLAFVAACLLAGAPAAAGPAPAAGPAGAPLLSWAGVAAAVLAFQLTIGTYGGWNSAIYFAEEDENPTRNIPRSLLGGVVLVTAIYLLVNLGLLRVLSMPQIAASTLPVADAMQRAFGGVSGRLVTGLSLLSLLGILNAVFMTTPRVLYALGRDGLFSGRATAVTAGGTPIVALGVTAAGAVLLAMSGTFETLLSVYAVIVVAVNVAMVATLFVLRRREPDLPRPYRAWGYPLAPLLLLAVDSSLCVGFAVTNPRNSVIGAGLLALSYPVYVATRRAAGNRGSR